MNQVKKEWKNIPMFQSQILQLWTVQLIKCTSLFVTLTLTGLEEQKAHDFLCDFLEKHGFEVERHYLLDTAFRATYRNGTGPHVAVLCEYDALPEIGHACGHNLIAEAGAGAGLAIKAAMAAAEENIGTVRVGMVTKLMMVVFCRPWVQKTTPLKCYERATF